MLLLTCPHCGPRDEREFVYGGPSAAKRPDDAGGISEEAWIEHLTVPPNPVGAVAERWWHARGCGEWIEVSRDTATHDLGETGG